MTADPTAPAPLGGRVKRALAWSTLNSIALRFGSLGVGILLARLLAPEEFGVFAVALTVQTIVISLADLGMSADIIRHGVQGRAGTVTTISSVAGVLLASGMFLAAWPVAAAMGSPQATPVVQVMSLTLVLSGLSVVPYAVMQREFRQRAQLGLDGASLVLSTVVTVGLVLLGMGAMALAISRVLAQSMVTVLQFLLTRSRPTFGFDPAVARSLLRFGVPLAGANVLSWVVMNVGHLTVGATAGAVMLGLYTLAFNISTWPMSALGVAIRAVALPAFATVTDPRRKAAGFVSAAALTWSLALLVGVLLSGLASVVVPLLYGQRWSMAADALAGLAFFGAFRVLFDLVATFLIAVGASRALFVAQVVWLAALFPAVILGVRWYGLAGAGVGHALVCALIILPMYAIALRRHGVRLRSLTGALVLPLVVAAPAVVLGLFVVRSLPGALWQLLGGGAVMTVAFVGPLLPWLRRRLRELKDAGQTADEPVAPAGAPAPTGAAPTTVSEPAGSADPAGPPTPLVTATRA
ncbi:lipopolysaccharide biosynthesis protein [Micromonospora sp. NBC_01813]|uniref:lipopolysaccharide biosynthesis protein n=1 Tax=Micromonospora sp. NBC_01813 TaxID=2975988 RepID=UPI002DD98B23|nr:lipopolysaccharide biosynthesis protein [Micromonospora sp. NBC_01813]WSA08855.1 lipopolysaccharide biosynthesis protein [Micromonospora sp. NBC_01813]